MSESVLDRNLRGLLRRAYHPASPRADFLARAEAAVLAARPVGSRAPAPEASPAPPSRRGPAARPARRPAWRPLLAAAALLLVALAGVRWLVLRGQAGGPAPIAQPSPGEREADPRPGAGRGRVAEAGDGALLPAPVDAGSPPVAMDLTPSPPDPWSAPPALGELRWEVVDAASGEPVQHITASLVQQTIGARGPEVQSRTLSDEVGRYRWEGVAPESYAFFVQAEGYAVHVTRGLRVPGDEPPAPLRASLDQGGTLRGRVVDAASGEPVPGALVLSETDAPALMLPFAAESLPAGVRARALTGEDGRFELTMISAGPQQLRVTAEGHAPEWSAPLPLRVGERLEGVELALEPEAGLSGRVTQTGGRGLPGAIVIASVGDEQRVHPCFGYELAVTGADGGYSMGRLPPEGVVMVLMFTSGQAAESGEPPRMQPAEMRPGREVVVDFELEPTAAGTRVHGFVTEADGRPVPGAILSFNRQGSPPAVAPDAWRTAFCDEAGRYEVLDLAPGSWEVFYVEGAGRTVVRLGLVEAGGAGMRHDLRLPAGRLGGSVLAAAGGAPVTRAFVLLEREASPGAWEFHGRAMGDAQGGWSVPRLSPGRYRLTAHSFGPGDLAFSRVDGLSLGPGEVREGLALRLEQGGAVAVRLTGPDGSPLAGAPLAFVDAAGDRVAFAESMRTNAEGRFVAHGVAPGRWEVEAPGAGREAVRVAVDVRAGETASVELSLPDEP